MPFAAAGGADPAFVERRGDGAWGCGAGRLDLAHHRQDIGSKGVGGGTLCRATPGSGLGP
jgi:hypothetical protein